MLRHGAFFEELAKLDDTDPSWRTLTAALVLLRHIDQCIDDQRTETSEHGETWAVAGVRDAVAAVEETTPYRRILGSIADVVSDSGTVDARALTPRLMAFARALEYDAKWPLAIDVYQTITAYANPIDDPDVVAMAYIQLGICFRNVGDLDAALDACHRAQDVANAAGDMNGVLRARIVEAKIAISRGNLPRAEQVLDETIDEAVTQSLGEVHWRALHERATVAGMRGQFDRAIQFAYTALPLATSQRDRDRILNDVATGFLSLRVLDIARDAYLVLLATAQDQDVRWIASMNLMEIAGLQGAETVFDRYRRELSGAELAPHLHASYLLVAGRGYRDLGRPAAAVPYLREALGYAVRHQLNHTMFEAEEALKEIADSGGRAAAPAAASVPGEVAHIADAIRAMREGAGVGD